MIYDASRVAEDLFRVLADPEYPAVALFTIR